MQASFLLASFFLLCFFRSFIIFFTRPTFDRLANYVFACTQKLPLWFCIFYCNILLFYYLSSACPCILAAVLRGLNISATPKLCHLINHKGAPFDSSKGTPDWHAKLVRLLYICPCQSTFHLIPSKMTWVFTRLGDHYIPVVDSQERC